VAFGFDCPMPSPRRFPRVGACTLRQLQSSSASRLTARGGVFGGK
jgi:hypothetical protein